MYVQELKYAKQGRKYRGKITLSDKDEDAELIEILQAFIRGDMPEEWDVSDEWNEVIPEEAINWLKNYVPKLAGVLSTDVTSKVSSVIRESMMTGSTLKERMKALRESSEVIQRMTDARIESIARTEITRADSMGRLISMKSNDDVIGVEFSAIMDDRTTEICSERHGLFMRLDDPRLPENTPPLHVRCRSLLLPCTVYDFPDGLLTSHEFDEVPASKQRDYDIEEVRTLLGGLNNAVEETVLVPNPQTRAEEIIRQATEYKRQYDELQGQMEAAIARGDVSEYNRLSQLQNDVLNQWRQNVPSDELRNAKIEMAEQGVIYASGISKKLSSSDVTEIVQIVEGAPAPIRRVWNLLEGDMKIADTNSRNSYYSSREGAVHVDFLPDKYGSNGRPRYGVLFHELGHLIDNKAIGLGGYVSCAEELHNSLCGEVNSYISSTLVRLRSEALSAGQNPKAIKRSDAYTVVEKEISGQLTMREKIAVSDVFSGVTKNKVNDGWTHSTSYWKENDKNVCLEFFAQTFADSINNPEAIETTKRYFPESYKIFESMITKIGEKKS